MSFNNTYKGHSFEAGWFLANNEDVTRETMEISQTGAVTNELGGKIVKAGTAYPSNDASAIGIVYEDVDVTTGNMPGSVVTKGEIYEDRLVVTGVTYTEVSNPTGNPKEKGYYEKNGNVYSLTEDTTIINDKIYYTVVEERLATEAKTALEALGFKFKTSPTITR